MYQHSMTTDHLERRVKAVERWCILYAFLLAVAFLLIFSLATVSPSSAEEGPTPPEPQPTMAEPVAVSTTFPPVVPLEPTESSALTPTATPVACSTVELDRERAKVARLRLKVERLKANR